jgi:peptidoglycan/xylan/chitin deacetylase (PgdA/CDA1 family)
MLMIKRVAKLAGSIVFFFVDSLAGILRNPDRSKRYPRCVILYYHGVRKEEKERFARQMDTVLRWTVPVSLRDGFAGQAGRCYTAVTFDDGFISVIRNALPLLRERKIPAMMFVTAGCLGKKLPWSDLDGGKIDRIMTCDELKSFASDPSERITIGSHCITHASLLSLDDEHARREIAESRQELEKITGQVVRHLSYPAGEYEEREVCFAREAGYLATFSIEPKLAFENRDEFVIGRVKVDPSDWQIEFILKIWGYYRWLCWAYRIKKRLRSLTGLRDYVYILLRIELLRDNLPWLAPLLTERILD